MREGVGRYKRLLRQRGKDAADAEDEVERLKARVEELERERARWEREACEHWDRVRLTLALPIDTSSVERAQEALSALAADARTLDAARAEGARQERERLLSDEAVRLVAFKGGPTSTRVADEWARGLLEDLAAVLSHEEEAPR